MAIFPTIRFSVRKSTVKGSKDGSIQCYIFFRSQQKSFSTGLKIPLKHWDKKRGEPKSTVNIETQQIQTYLESVKSELLDIFKQSMNAGQTLMPSELYFSYKAIKSKTPRKEKTITDIAHELIMEKKGEISDKTHYEYNHFLNYWNDFLAHYGLEDPEPSKVTKDMIRLYKQYFRDIKKHAQSTINDRYYKVLKAVLIYARDYDFPIKASVLNSLSRSKSYEVKRVFLIKKERTYLEKLYEAGKANEIIKLIILAYHTGLRYSDLKNNGTWQGIDNPERPVLKLWDKKEENFCFIPLSRKAYQILREFDFKPNYLTNTKFNTAMQEELQKHAIFNEERSIPKFSEPIKVSLVLTAHDLRRTFVNFLLESGIRKEQIMLATGHKTSDVFDIYADYFTAVGNDLINQVTKLP